MYSSTAFRKLTIFVAGASGAAAVGSLLKGQPAPHETKHDQPTYKTTTQTNASTEPAQVVLDLITRPGGFTERHHPAIAAFLFFQKHLPQPSVLELAEKAIKNGQGETFNTLVKCYPAFLTSDIIYQLFEKNGLSERVAYQLQNLHATEKLATNLHPLFDMTILHGHKIFEPDDPKISDYLVQFLKNNRNGKTTIVVRSPDEEFATFYNPKEFFTLQISVENGVIQTNPEALNQTLGPAVTNTLLSSSITGRPLPQP